MQLVHDSKAAAQHSVSAQCMCLHVRCAQVHTDMQMLSATTAASASSWLDSVASAGACVHWAALCPSHAVSHMHKWLKVDLNLWLSA
jgi:hypothetical protein